MKFENRQSESITNSSLGIHNSHHKKEFPEEPKKNGIDVIRKRDEESYNLIKPHISPGMTPYLHQRLIGDEKPSLSDYSGKERNSFPHKNLKGEKFSITEQKDNNGYHSLRNIKDKNFSPGFLGDDFIPSSLHQGENSHFVSEVMNCKRAERNLKQMTHEENYNCHSSDENMHIPKKKETESDMFHKTYPLKESYSEKSQFLKDAVLLDTIQIVNYTCVSDEIEQTCCQRHGINPNKQKESQKLQIYLKIPFVNLKEFFGISTISHHMNDYIPLLLKIKSRRPTNTKTVDFILKFAKPCNYNHPYRFVNETNDWDGQFE